MAKLGRRLAEDEALVKTRLLSLIPEDPPGSRFNELVRAAKAAGFSKPTLWRHLTRFQKLGLVLHEGTLYRRNPLHPADLRAARSALDNTDEKDWRKLRSLAARDYWGSREMDLSDVDNPSALLCEAIELALTGYLMILAALRGIPDLSEAREFANLMFNAHVKLSLLVVARLIWEKRELAILDALDGREIKLTIKGPASPKAVFREPEGGLEPSKPTT
jgi:AcrR family transcriptional regulator